MPPIRNVNISNTQTYPSNRQSTDPNNEFEAINSDSESSTSSCVSWIIWYISLPNNDFLLEVPEPWIIDTFNMTGLVSLVPHYTQALNTILDYEQGGITGDYLIEVEESASLLYTLIHQRYILTKPGMHEYRQRHIDLDFGKCCRDGCFVPLMPSGTQNEPGKSVVMYCRRCMDIYKPEVFTIPKEIEYRGLDGCAFGTTFCSLFFLTYPDLVILETVFIYRPAIHGFKISCIAKNRPSMSWMRRWETVEEPCPPY